MLERIEKLQVISLGVLIGLALVVSTKMVSSTISNNVISVTGSAYEIVKSDSGTLSFDIVVKRATKQLAYSDVQNQIKQIEFFKEYMSSAVRKYEEEYKSKSKIYVSIGFSFGTVIALVLI